MHIKQSEHFINHEYLGFTRQVLIANCALQYIKNEKAPCKIIGRKKVPRVLQGSDPG